MLELAGEIEALKKNQLLRNLVGGFGIDFCSNDYLGLAANKQIREKLISWLERQNFLGATSSRLIRGSTDLHQQTEEFLAEFLRRPASLLFTSGYAANEGLISTLAKDAVIFSDRHNHASLIDGIRLSRSSCEIYRHNDTENLESLIKKHLTTTPKWVITEALFSMDGDCAPMGDILRICKQYDAHLLLDEAHSTGVFGKQGAGILSQWDFDQDRVFSVHTCGKALGGFGAFVGCSKKAKTYLVNKCRHFIYTTALAPLNVYHIKLAVEHIWQNPQLRQQLATNTTHAKKYFPKAESPIVPVILGSNQRVLACSDFLKEHRLDVRGIRYPTVAKGTERLRLSIHADHTRQEIDLLGQKIQEFLRKETQ